MINHLVGTVYQIVDHLIGTAYQIINHLVGAVYQIFNHLVAPVHWVINHLVGTVLVYNILLNLVFSAAHAWLTRSGGYLGHLGASNDSEISGRCDNINIGLPKLNILLFILYILGLALSVIFIVNILCFIKRVSCARQGSGAIRCILLTKKLLHLAGSCSKTESRLVFF
jgi:hypothetical protein